MMNHLREFGQGFAAKILLGFLVLVFGFWGIGDIFRSGSLNRPVATVGNTSISTQEFQQQLHRRIEELHQMLGASYSPELAKQLHVENQVLSSIINSRLMEQEAAAQGIVVDDRSIADYIRRSSNFAGSDGKFDKALYQARVKSEDGSEQRYIHDLRNDMQVELLSDAWSAGAVVPDALVEKLYDARAQQRIISLNVFSPDSLTDIPAPSDQELKKYYEERTKQFAIPEYRTLRLIELSPTDIASKITISDADLAHEYDARKQEFFAPEKRDVKQMIFAKEADAKLAVDKFNKGKSFKDIAASMQPTNKDKISLGLVSKQELPTEVADAVFALKVNTITAPIQTEFGWNLLYVEHIQPEGEQSLDQVHDLLLKDMRGKQAQDTIYRLMTELQDALAGGQSVEAAAQKVGAKIESFPPIAHNAEDEKGKKVTLPSQIPVLNAAFSLSEKDNSPPIQAEDGGVIIVHVDQITPERTKSFDEVKDQVTKGWSAQKRQIMLHNKVEAVATHVREGKTFEQAMEQEHIKASVTATGIKVAHDTNKFSEPAIEKIPVSPMLINAVFHTQVQKSTDAVALADGSYCIASVQEIIPAPDFHKSPDEKTLSAVHNELESGLSNDVLNSYLAYLRTKYTVSINQDMIQKLEGDESNE